MSEETGINPYVSKEEYVKALSESSEMEKKKCEMFKNLVETFDNPTGARVLEWFGREVCGFGQSCFSEDSLTMARKAGRQEAYLILRDTIERAKKGTK